MPGSRPIADAASLASDSKTEYRKLRHAFAGEAARRGLCVSTVRCANRSASNVRGLAFRLFLASELERQTKPTNRVRCLSLNQPNPINTLGAEKVGLKSIYGVRCGEIVQHVANERRLSRQIFD